MNKQKYKITAIILIVAFILILILSNVSAIGIAPGKKVIQFEPNLEQDIGFSIINNEHKHLRVLLFARGELKQSITLPKTIVELTPEQEEVRLSYKVNLPDKIEVPGTYKAEIVAMEISEGKGEGIFVEARAAVISTLNVDVPVPGKYAEAVVDITSDSPDEPRTFLIKVFNRGKLDIVRAKATVEIFGSTNEKLATLNTQEKPITSGERIELAASWNDKNINPGPYFAIITVVYDGETQKIEKRFEIGSLIIDVDKIEVKNFRLGGVAKFDITIENKWNQLINDVFAQMQIRDEDGEVIADIKSSSENLDPLSKAVLNTFWDTEGIREGTYDTKVILHYQDKQTEKQYKSFVTLENIIVAPLGITGQAVMEGGVGKGSILVIIVFILIIINIGWLIYFKKRAKQGAKRDMLEKRNL